jgi:hypothetical protein
MHFVPPEMSKDRSGILQSISCTEPKLMDSMKTITKINYFVLGAIS